MLGYTNIQIVGEKELDTHIKLKVLKDTMKEYCKLLNCDGDNKKVANHATGNEKNKEVRGNDQRKHFKNH